VLIPRMLTTMGALVAATLTLVSCGAQGHSTTTGHEPARTAQSTSLTGQAGTKTVDTVCAELGVDRRQCYALPDEFVAVDRPVGASRGLLLVDFGGPGLRAVAPGELRAELPRWAQHYTVATFLEPWAGRYLPEVCTGYFAHLSWGASTPASDKPSICDPFVADWQRTPIRSSVTSLEETEHQKLAGVVAFSFGVTRTAPLWGLLRSRAGFLAVVDPAAAPGVDGGSVVQERAQRSLAVLEKEADQWCAGACSDAHALLAQVGKGQAINGVSSSEAAALVLAAAADPGLLPTLKGLAAGPASPETKANVSRVANSFARTLDGQTATVANIGYRSQMCQAYGPVAGLANTGDAYVQSLARLMGPCDHDNTSAWDRYGSVLPERTCVIVDEQDPVRPGTLGGPLDSVGATRTVAYSSPGHRWPQELVAKLGDPAGAWACR
jgi:hypothetical protein